VHKNKKKRVQYDHLGHASFDQQYSREDIFRGADFDSVFRDMGFGDLFRTFFGGSGFSGGGGYERADRGQDIGYNIEITLEDSANGVEKEIQIPRTERCDTCGGSGAKPGTNVASCQKCRGAGKVQIRHAFVMLIQDCPHCRGRGVHIETPCGSCSGSGLVRRKRKISVKIPIGIEDGSRLRFRGEGEMAANGREAGDLYVVVHVLPHQLFVREGDDLYRVEMITFPQAALGAEISVPTLDGPAMVKIQPGTQSGEVVRVKGRGMPRMRGYNKGDLIVRVGIYVPDKLSSQQRVLLEQLAKEFGTDISSKKGKFRF
jgi:molecular chaperone DnaJ